MSSFLENTALQDVPVVSEDACATCEIARSIASACISLITNDSFLPGIIALSKSIRTHSKYAFHIMVTNDVSESTLTRLRSLCDEVITVDAISNPYDQHQDVSWTSSALTKLNIWRLTQFEKIVYIDADAIVMSSIDELFDLKCSFAAAPDIFPPDKFNAGSYVHSFMQYDVIKL